MKVPPQFKTFGLLSCLLFFLSVLDGCIIIFPHPSGEREPFGGNDKSIRFGYTKTEILRICGKPDSTRLGERIFIYARCIKPYNLFGLVISLSDIKSADRRLPLYDTYLLIVEFNNNDVVINYQVFQGDTGNVANGLYIIQNGVFMTFVNQEVFRKWDFSDERLILGASKPMDEEAKKFALYPDKSVIYYYKNFSDISEIKMNGSLSADPGSEGFLMWVVEPGSHTIATSYDDHPESIYIDCNLCTIYYVEHKKGSLKQVPKSIAEKEISKRRLVIDRLNMLRF